MSISVRQEVCNIDVFDNEITKNMQIIAKKEGQFTDDFGNIHCERFK